MTTSAAPSHSLPPNAPLSPYRKYRSVRGVLHQHRRAETHTAFHRPGDLAGDIGLAAQDAVLIGKGEAHDGDSVRLESFFDLARGSLAVAGPQAGLLGEMHLGQATRGGRVCFAQSDPLRRRASNSFQ